MKEKLDIFYSIVFFLIWYLSTVVTSLYGFQFSLLLLFVGIVVWMLWIHSVLPGFWTTREELRIPNLDYRGVEKIVYYALYPIVVFILTLWISIDPSYTNLSRLISLISLVLIYIQLYAIRDISRNIFIVTKQLRISLEFSTLYIFFLSTLILLKNYTLNWGIFLAITIIAWWVLFTEFVLFDIDFRNRKSILIFLMLPIVLLFSIYMSAFVIGRMFLLLNASFVLFMLIVHMRFRGIRELREYIFAFIIYLILLLLIL